MTRRDAWVPVAEDWYGNFKIEDDRRFQTTRLVLVSAMGLSDGKYRVCVWGNDDFGLERDFDQPGEAMTLFQLIVSQPYPTKEWLKNLDMVPA
jgi:hypothetical protein